MPSRHSSYQDIQKQWESSAAQSFRRFADRESSYLEFCPPPEALKIGVRRILQLLQDRYGGNNLRQALEGNITSPVSANTDSSWLEESRMIGINVRTLGTFWKIIPYLLSTSTVWNSVHLLPIWEPGVIGSLYGMSSWEINNEFYDRELAEEVPELSSVELQLKAVINIIHLMGRSVGMDVIPHTDRFSEMVLSNPRFFEWIQRSDDEILDFGSCPLQLAEDCIWEWVQEAGPAVPRQLPQNAGYFFHTLTESERNLLLFGPPHSRETRNARRGKLISLLYSRGLEPAPATMAPPFRGLEIDQDITYTDEFGQVWRDYRMIEPQGMSRVFGPLTRYRLFESIESSDSEPCWELDFRRPVKECWKYVAEHYAAVQKKFSFDFMRGDMSHVQMRPDGVPGTEEEIGNYYDILGYVKQYIIQHEKIPWFGYFAESFLAGRNVFGYGEEIDHLEASAADCALGDLQSLPPDSQDFMSRFRRLLDMALLRRCTPCFTIITGDKDDPRFDQFYRHGNTARYFTALFLKSMPSYMALGFETREERESPARNDYYTKLYVFQERSGSNMYPDKSTSGPYRWNENGEQFISLHGIQQIAEKLLPDIAGEQEKILIPPDPETGNRIFVWHRGSGNNQYVFAVNFASSDYGSFGIPALDNYRLELRFSSITGVPNQSVERIAHNAYHYRINELMAGEARIYHLVL
ncbi:alpha-amylase family protein [Spirochaeta dissipatitropha]